MAAISARVNFPLGLILPFAPDSKPSFTARVRAAADQSVGKSENSAAAACVCSTSAAAKTAAIKFFCFKNLPPSNLKLV